MVDGVIISQTQRPARIEIQRFEVEEIAAEIVGEHLEGYEEAVAAVVDTGGVTGAVGLIVDFEFELMDEIALGIVSQSLKIRVASWEFGSGS